MKVKRSKKLFIYMIKAYLLKILELFRYRRSYSQDGEDMVLRSLMEDYPKGYKGVFVDIGAHHPVRFSNTYFFYKKGWRGINVDAMPGSMNLFKWLRSKDVNLEVGVGPENDNLTFYCFDEPALNTFSEETALERDQNTRYKIIKKVEVPVMKLAEILETYLSAPKIDLLSIDVEGLDHQVLMSNNWDKYRPVFILVEDNDFMLTALDRSVTYQFLVNKVYELSGKTKRTLVFKLRE